MSDTVQLSRAGFTVRYVDEDFSRRALDGLLPDPDRLFDGAIILKPGTRTHAGVVSLLGQKVFLKRYNDRGFIYRVLNALRRSRAWHAWRVARALQNVGLPVARPLVCLEERRFRLLHRSYVLMEFVDGGESLTKVWEQVDDGIREKILRQIGDILGRMHAANVLHGDLKWGNILVSSADDYRVTFVDFDGGVLVNLLGRIGVRKDLERFLRDLDKRSDNHVFREALLSDWSVHTGLGLQ